MGFGKLDALLARAKRLSRRKPKKKAKKKGKKKSKKKAAPSRSVDISAEVQRAVARALAGGRSGLSRKSAPKASGGPKKKRSPAQIAATKRMLAGLKRKKKMEGR